MINTSRYYSNAI